jgi:hypothetical protein
VWNIVLVRSETVLVLEPNRSTVCTKRTIGSRIILDTPNSTLGHKAQVEARFCPFGGSANHDAR